MKVPLLLQPQLVEEDEKSKKDDTTPVIRGAQTKPKENPLKKELANPSGLDFANQMGAILAQPTQNLFVRCRFNPT